ncbi:glutamate racemase, partial [Bacteroidota bacterium]
GKPDSIRDFIHEQFVYLADQANMPYSNYAEIHKKELLVEHILKNAIFLINKRFHPTPFSDKISHDKPEIKAMVIACNTATAYGKDELEEFLKLQEINMKVIGVIDAGANGALECLENSDSGIIAVFATPATVKSKAYVSAINRIIAEKHYSGNIQIVQQGGKGLHESIDNKPEFIKHGTDLIYEAYQGPSLNDDFYKIEKKLLDVYRFDTTENHLLYNHRYLKQSDTIQINSIENYVRYHVVSLIEKLSKSGTGPPLKSIILGCTHYPYVKDEIEKVFNELKSLPEYSSIIAEEIRLIDPAENTAAELYSYLAENDLLNIPDRDRIDESLFFISVPNTSNPAVEVTDEGGFTYQYQYYDREINQLQDYTLIVPFSNKVISISQLQQIQRKFPTSYNIISEH